MLQKLVCYSQIEFLQNYGWIFLFDPYPCKLVLIFTGWVIEIPSGF